MASEVVTYLAGAFLAALALPSVAMAQSPGQIPLTLGFANLAGTDAADGGSGQGCPWADRSASGRRPATHILRPMSFSCTSTSTPMERCAGTKSGVRQVVESTKAKICRGVAEPERKRHQGDRVDRRPRRRCSRWIAGAPTLRTSSAASSNAWGAARDMLSAWVELVLEAKPVPDLPTTILELKPDGWLCRNRSQARRATGGGEVLAGRQGAALMREM